MAMLALQGYEEQLQLSEPRSRQALLSEAVSVQSTDLLKLDSSAAPFKDQGHRRACKQLEGVSCCLDIGSSTVGALNTQGFENSTLDRARFTQ